MTTVYAPNPFDDSFESATPRQGSTSSTNPFDDSTSPHPRTTNNINNSNSNVDGNSSNPFTDNESYTDDDMLLLDENEPAPSSAAANAEASWQYLRDLPYRRIPIYSNVQWQRLATPTNPNPSANNKNEINSQSNARISPSSMSSNKGNKNDRLSMLSFLQTGLAMFPPTALKHHPKILDPLEVRHLLSKTTVTHVKGCPQGGPLAVVTLPVVSGQEGFAQTELRILTTAGQAIAQFHLPPAGLEHRYHPADVLTVGFTARTTLVVVLHDSLCLTYNVRGEPLLPPFYILPHGEAVGTCYGL